MKKIFVAISCFTLLCLQCTQPKINHSNVAYCKVSYIDFSTSFYIPRVPSNFYQTKDLYYLTIKGADTCEKFNKYFNILKANKKAKYQDDPIDPRFALKIKYNDSTEKSVFIDVAGYYMLDTLGSIYIENFDFLKYTQNIINDTNIVNWHFWIPRSM